MKFKIVILSLSIFGFMVFTQNFTTSNLKVVEQKNRVPLRNLTRLNATTLLGASVTMDPATQKQRISVISSVDGVTWNYYSSFNPNVVGSYRLGDPTILYSPSHQAIYCSFRVEHLITGARSKWSIHLWKFDVGQSDIWEEDTIIEKEQSTFVGAPFLLVDSQKVLHIFYDSEPIATEFNRFAGEQFIAEQKRGLLDNQWSGPTIVSTPVKGLNRDGMATAFEITSIGSKVRIMVAYEGVEESPSAAGHSANIILTSATSDGGNTWGERRIIYQSNKREAVTGKRFNAYAPYMSRMGRAGPAVVVFATDEDFDVPDHSYSPIIERSAHIKNIQTTVNYETWTSTPSTVIGDNDVHMYGSEQHDHGKHAYFQIIYDFGENQPLIITSFLDGYSRILKP